MDSLGYRFIDLTTAMRELPQDEQRRLFIEDGDAAGHYTEVGNRVVAEVLYERLITPLLSMPGSRGCVGQPEGSSGKGSI